MHTCAHARQPFPSRTLFSLSTQRLFPGTLSRFVCSGLLIVIFLRCGFSCLLQLLAGAFSLLAQKTGALSLLARVLLQERCNVAVAIFVRKVESRPVQLVFGAGVRAGGEKLSTYLDVPKACGVVQR